MWWDRRSEQARAANYKQAAKVRERLSVNKRVKQQFIKQGHDLKTLYVVEDTKQFKFQFSNTFPGSCDLGYSGVNNIASVSVGYSRCGISRHEPPPEEVFKKFCRSKKTSKIAKLSAL
jgi:Fic family protein